MKHIGVRKFDKLHVVLTFGTCSCLDFRYDPARLTLQSNRLFKQYQLII